MVNKQKTFIHDIYLQHKNAKHKHNGHIQKKPHQKSLIY